MINKVKVLDKDPKKTESFTGSTAKVLDNDPSIKDSLENLVASMGTDMDKRTHSRITNRRRLSDPGNQQEINNMYRTDWLSGKVVDIIPDDMTREWRSFDGEIEPDIIKQLIDEEERLDLRGKFNDGDKWGRLYGTAYLIIAVDDGLEPHEPLIIANIKPGDLSHLTVVDRHRVYSSGVTHLIEDPMNKNFGMPEFYSLVGSAQTRIHHSRVIRFEGVKLPFEEFRNNKYNSDSVLDRLYESIINFMTVTEGTASMVHEANVDIVSVKGMMNLLQTPEGEERIRKRFSLASRLKSFNNMMILDSEEAFNTKTNSFAGLKELINEYGQLLAAASDIPATRLLGSSASGLNATGEGDLKNYYDMIKSKQISRYKPKLDYLDQIMAANIGLSPETDLSYTFNSLFQMTDREVADIGFINGQRDALYLDREVVTPSTVAKDLQQNGTYSNLTDEEINELEKFENEPSTFATGSENTPGNEPEEKEGEEGQTSENQPES